MNVADWLEVVAQALSALLAVWLGLTVATRSSLPVARVFTFLALVVATWSSSIILQRLTTSLDATAVGRSIEDLAAALAIGGLAHFALVVATDGHPTRRQLGMIAAVYAILLAFALPDDPPLRDVDRAHAAPLLPRSHPGRGAVLGLGCRAARSDRPGCLAGCCGRCALGSSAHSGGASSGRRWPRS